VNVLQDEYQMTALNTIRAAQQMPGRWGDARILPRRRRVRDRRRLPRANSTSPPRPRDTLTTVRTAVKAAKHAVTFDLMADNETSPSGCWRGIEMIPA
jgi:hypothetical protein